MSIIQDFFYPKVPVLIQNLMISAYGFCWQKRRFGGIFNHAFEGFKTREVYSLNQWQQYQTVELRKMLVHAFETVPHYNYLYKKHGYKRTDFENFELEGLSKLPALEKNNLRKYGTSLLLSTKREKKGQFFSSSGSTGTPTSILFSNNMHQRWSAAFEARIRNWANLTRFDSRGMIGGRRVVPDGESEGPFYRYNFFEKQIYFSA